jgi:site-specific DNA-methyltransferase (adenine-specific)
MIALDRVHHGDCLEGLARLPAGSVDLAFADPPFNIGYDYDIYHDRRACDEYLGWSRRWMEAVRRVLKPDGTFWLAIGDEYAAELKVIACREVGFHLRSWVVWYYTFGVNCSRKFSRSHAHLFYFVMDPQRFTFNDEAIRVPSARQRVYADKRANPRGRLPDDTWILRPQEAPEGSFAPDHDTWYVSRVCGTFRERAGWHGCQMPEQLLGRLIRACSNRGEVVLDPFAGSGTTLAVAKKLHRRFVGFELSADYVRRIEDRLARIRPGDPLEGGPEPAVNGVKPRRPRTAGQPARALFADPLPPGDGGGPAAG